VYTLGYAFPGIQNVPLDLHYPGFHSDWSVGSQHSYKTIVLPSHVHLQNHDLQLACARHKRVEQKDRDSSSPLNVSCLVAEKYCKGAKKCQMPPSLSATRVLTHRQLTI
jgi:hypothetical protein